MEAGKTVFIGFFIIKSKEDFMSEEVNEVAEPEAEIEVKDDFSDAFNKAADAAEAAEAINITQPEKEVVVEPTEPVVPEKEAKPVESVVDEKPQENWEQKYKSLQGMFNKTSAELKEAKAKIPEPKKEEPSPEEDEEMKNFLQEFDYLAKPITRLVEKMVSERTGEVESKTNANVQATNRIVADLVISAQHPDFYELRETGEVRNWVDTLPDAEKEAYTRVCDEGSIKEVIGLISDYKKAVKAPALEEQKQKELEKQTKLTNLAAVKRKPGAINSSSGKVDDFNSAFAQRAAELEQRR